MTRPIALVATLVVGAIAGIVVWTAPLWAAWAMVLALIIVVIAVTWEEER